MLTPEQIQSHLETLEELAFKGSASEERMSELLALSDFQTMSVVEAMCPALYKNIVGTWSGKRKRAKRNTEY